MTTATFAKLKREPGQPFGVRIKPPNAANSGDQVTVTTQSGGSKTVVLGSKVATFEDAALFTIAGDGSQTPSAPAQSQASAFEDVTPKGDAFWAQKDRRISRAGLLQAVVSATTLQPGIAADNAKVVTFVTQVNTITDALMASLDERTPSPNS